MGFGFTLYSQGDCFMEKNDSILEKETNRERFIRIAEKRTQRIIDQLELLGNCSNPYNYEYSSKDVDKMFGAIEAAIKDCRSKYTNTATKNTKFKF